MSRLSADNTNTKAFVVGFFSFFIPVFVAVFAYYQQGIFPGGPNTILIYDMRGELLPLYGYIVNRGPGYDDLLHWMSGGLGGGFVGTMAMYLSLFDILFIFVKTIDLPLAIYFLTVLKIGLCGLFFSVFVDKSFVDSNLSFVAKILFSCMYALMSYVFAYSIILVWIDGVMLLPLLAVCADRIAAGEKSIRFVLLFSILMIDDYYISFMIAIFLVFYVVYKLTEQHQEWPYVLQRLKSLLIHGILSAGIASFFIIPVIFDLLRGKLAENVSISNGLVVKNGIIDVVRMHLPSSYTDLGSNQPPYIFCGSIVIVLAIIWFVKGKNDLTNRIVAIVIVSIYYCSFIIGPLDRIWHGFRDPVGFSCRYSFTFVFFLICFSIKGYLLISKIEVKISKSLYRLTYVMILVYTIVELTMNSSFLLSKLMEDYTYSNREEYERVCDVMEYCLDQIGSLDGSDYYRMIKNFNYSCMDGALFGYDGLEMFTSSYNHGLIEFLNKIGFNSSNNFIKEIGATPPALNILNIGYFMSYWYDESDLYSPIASYRSFSLYKNNDTFPFAYYIADDANRNDHPFVSNPFENINYIYSDIFGSGNECNVFENCDFSVIEDDSSYAYTKIRFTPTKDGHYWIYPELNYSYGNDQDEDYMPSDLTYISCYVDGVYTGECGFYNFRYCGDLGYLNAGHDYKIILDTPMQNNRNIYIDYYDETLSTELGSRADGLDLEYIGRKGIILSGIAKDESDLIITLPYESGYQVYVNDIKTDYSGYRNALMMIHLEKGENVVRIKYLPSGFAAGIICSIIFLCISYIYFGKNILLRRGDIL
jgi:uncharacterized membrane protein YfhO